MYIPPDAEIDPRKLTDYLLVPLPADDKSGYLAQAGFVPATAAELHDAIRTLCATAEAAQGPKTEYGTKYLVTGTIQGPNGRTLGVRLIWMQRAIDQQFHFVTLVPAAISDNAADSGANA